MQRGRAGRAAVVHFGVGFRGGPSLVDMRGTYLDMRTFEAATIIPYSKIAKGSSKLHSTLVRSIKRVQLS